ncbi:S41 family peptidase [Pseudanabaena sp. FACHB-2040]|uniref:S41 family peptidase n=1 Tax=Pseudanabaena sp. FACHB-2040 TaxID=2692859 RepID=UPI001689A0DD|nr:S41 family peptidase [Pseudanabaena sp. FACHB-2040]MBD2258413.1 PDZ domain-containing protein [Pseudanabaena sp. FACHB-2040]
MNLSIRTLRFSPASLMRGAIASSLLAIPTAPAFATSSAQPVFEDSPKAVLDEAWQIIDQHYVDGDFNRVDWQAVRQSLLGREYTSRDEAYSALRTTLRQLNDPYTRFLSPREYSELTEQTSGEVSGVGLRLRRDTQTSKVFVTEVAEGSPAQQAGLQPGDQLLLVDSQTTDRITIEGISQRLRGEEGTQVTLTVSRNGTAPRTVILTRTLQEIPTVEHAVKQQGNSRIGYIRLGEFNAHAAEQMERAITNLTQENVEGFVLDLRGNPGGLYQASITISRMWLQRGSIVQLIDREGHSESIRANGTAITQLPLTVLVDGRSASSSEILTGALRDNGRATVVGSTTFGKALVQSLHGLSDGSGLTVTVAHYYTPNGTDLSRKGIVPDIEVELSDRQRQELFNNPVLLGTDADIQYLQAAQVLEQTILSLRQPGTVPGINTPSQLGRVEF